MIYRYIKKILKNIEHTCLHPQWFVYKGRDEQNREIGKVVKGRVLDVGCADQFIRNYLPENSEYVGLDYYQTATQWYKTSPDVFGDAQRLPFADATMDSVLLLDVLEHLPESNMCLSEIARVIKDKGTFVLQVPFLYPIHDAPLDFQRWTLYGLRHLVLRHGFFIKEEVLLGKSVETAGLLLNLALCNLLLGWIKNKKTAILLSVIIGPIIVPINVFCWFLSLISPGDNFMPHGYRLILEKHS